MRLAMPAAIVAFLPGGLFAQGCDIRWPDGEIPVPSEVMAFIASECRMFQGSSEEDVPACMDAERYGYRAVVSMLTEDATGEMAAERYRACRAGLGAEGGRFHRRRAECMGSSLGILWRFEFMRKAAADVIPRRFDVARSDASMDRAEF
jgi:hypothetical protein